MDLPNKHERYRIIAVLAALCLAFTAQYLFTGEVFTHSLDSNTWDWIPNYTWASILLLIAIFCALWGFSQRTKIEDSVISQGEPVDTRRNRNWLLGAGGCYLLSLLLYLINGENLLVQGLWLAGVGLLIVPLWLQNRKKPVEDHIASWEWGLVVLITLIGFGLRYWNLTEIPSHVDNDVSLMGTYALELIDKGNNNWIGFSESEHLLSYDQFKALSMRLFGQNLYGLVMLSVILGSLSLPAIFLLGRELGGRVVGLVASSLLAISYTHIHFSRILFGSSASFAAIFGLYLFFKGFRTQHPVWFALAGVIFGWSMLLYDSARIIPVILLTLLIWQWVWHRRTIKANWKNWAYLVAGGILAFGPMLAFAISDFHSFSGRGNSVFIWNPEIWEHEYISYNASGPFQVWLQQTWRTFLTLQLTGDGSPHFGLPRPMVSAPIAALFIIGLGYCIPRIKDLKYFSVITWFFLTFIFGGVLTYDPPYWPHLNIALPAILIIATFGVVELILLLGNLFGSRAYKISIGIMAIGIVLTGVINWNMYYDYVKDNAGYRSRMARYLASLPKGYRVYMVNPDFSWNEFSFRFLNRGMPGEDINPEKFTSDPPEITQPTVFIVFNTPGLVPALQRLYPDGIIEEHPGFQNPIAFTTYNIVPTGVVLQPVEKAFNPLNLPGWWLIIGVIVFSIAVAVFNRSKRYSNRKILSADGS